MPDGAHGSSTTGDETHEPSLEARLKRLEEIVHALEADDVELDRALALFEEGILHVRMAERALAAAELKVQELVGDGERGELRPFEEGIE